MIKEKSCGAIIYSQIDNEIYYLIVKSNEGYHDFSKGHVEKGESESETARREVREELNLDIELLSDYRLTTEYYIEATNSIKESIYFIAKMPKSTITLDHSELSDYGLYTYKEALNILERNETQSILKEAQQIILRDLI